MRIAAYANPDPTGRDLDPGRGSLWTNASNVKSTCCTPTSVRRSPTPSASSSCTRSPKSPRYVNELAEALHAPQPTVSRHLKVLRERRLVAAERDGANIRYSLVDDRVIDALDALRAVLLGTLAQQAELAHGIS